MIIDIIKELLLHKLFWAGTLGWAVAQVIKTIHLSITEKRFSFGLFVRRGNMPSSHASTVAALITALFLLEGVTTLSIFALFVAIIVLRDTLDINVGIPDKKKIGLQVRTYIHTPLEVCIGTFAGIIVGIVMYLI